MAFSTYKLLVALADAHHCFPFSNVSSSNREEVLTVTVVSFKLSCVAILALLEVDSERGTSFLTGQWLDIEITDLHLDT